MVLRCDNVVVDPFVRRTSAEVFKHNILDLNNLTKQILTIIHTTRFIFIGCFEPPS